MTSLPYLGVFTAERAAYRNLVDGLNPPASAIYMNPYREWIGAQIRADIFGYVSPGMPEYAAELAHRDGTLSHVKNGIYGEILISSMISAAFTTNDVREIVRIGLSEIPRTSRLAEAVKDVLDWSTTIDDWRSCWEMIMQKYGHYNWIHTINNAAMMLLGLLFGEGDYEKSITISVMSGLDTDCNGATVGSILGVIKGAQDLPKKWVEPLNDRIQSYVIGFDNSKITDLGNRTFKLAKKINAA